MTVMLGNADTTNVRLGSTQVDKLMLGEDLVWSSAPPMEPHFFTEPFNTQQGMEATFPHRGFDRRSIGTNPGWVFNGMLVAGDNSSATYWNVLAEEEFNGAGTLVQLHTGDIMAPLSRPTGIIFASDAAMTHMNILEIGSDGFRVRVVTPTADGATVTFGGSVGSATNIRVTRTEAGTYEIYRSGVYVNAWTPGEGNDRSMEPGFGHVGISMYSTRTAWSSRVSSIYASGDGYVS